MSHSRAETLRRALVVLAGALVFLVGCNDHLSVHEIEDVAAHRAAQMDASDALQEAQDSLPQPDTHIPECEDCDAPVETEPKVVVGSWHTCALLRDGIVKCWGWGREGATGMGSLERWGDEPLEMGSHLPRVDLGRRALDIVAGWGHTCAILSDHSVKCWGSNDLGKLGIGDQDDRGDEPGEMGHALPSVDLGSEYKVIDIAAGYYHTCALLDDGTVKCWGGNAHGQLGSGSSENIGDEPGEMGHALPSVDLGRGARAVAISGADLHTCALLEDGSVKCWGWNLYGELGLGHTENLGDAPGEMGESLESVDLGKGRRVRQVESGSHSCAVFEDGQIACWGLNRLGQLGLGDTNHRGDEPDEMGEFLPLVSLGGEVRSIHMGHTYACALMVDGALKCWGANGTGGLGLGDLETWGDDPGEMGDALPAVDLGTGRTAVFVDANIRHTCVVLDDDSIKCWGQNDRGQLGLGDDIQRGDEPGEMGDALQVVDLGI